ncbi:YitT family protein [Exiguobacterium marinum]|uniref:YitT family protein n=1 Tax=Exiguobacterium marinum TaxID=273528 RepID=A0ABY7X2S4_9BACL|nr:MULTISPECIES: YitT family protein [Exiguobacterium]WDH76398.1 YitT family protein [Exiguobacterium marinum]
MYAKSRKRVALETVLFIIAGTILQSIFVSLLLKPNEIGSGGIVGITLIFNELLGTPIGMTQLVLNIPLFLLGLKYLGRRFILMTGIVVVLSSILIDSLPILIPPTPLDDPLVASVFSGIVSGLGLALLLFAGASTGGLDILGKVIYMNNRNLSLPKIFLTQDLIVYILVFIVFDIKAVMYALVLSFVRSRTLLTIHKFFSAQKQCFIICQKAEEINLVIKQNLKRGVTIMDATGGYSNDSKKMLYVVVQNNEIPRLRQIVSEIDSEAFVTVSEIDSIVGNFKEHSYTL